jgi:hypothetical protein
LCILAGNREGYPGLESKSRNCSGFLLNGQYLAALQATRFFDYAAPIRVALGLNRGSSIQQTQKRAHRRRSA